MKLLGSMLSRAVGFVGALGVLMMVAGCDNNGSITDTSKPAPGGTSTVNDRNLSGVAGPSSGPTTPVERVPRASFATANTVEALIYPSATPEEREVFARALRFFITDRTPENGLGPIFNQRICLGCHRNADDVASLRSDQRSGNDSTLATFSTPASRASRQGPTNHARLNQIILDAINSGALIGENESVGKPPTAGFTLFGDFFPAAGAFNPLAEFGGPIQHIRATGVCYPDIIPPESIDPFLQGGIDPASGLSLLGGRRAVGERGAPPYVGRGLMEAIFADDIVANDDPDDADASGNNSALRDAAGNLLTSRFTNPECPGDCISGRHNENRADIAFIGGDPVIRVSRFGLRAAGPTLTQFMIGGTQGEIGLTSPFAPTEQNNNQNVGRDCDQAPDPELTADDILDLRRLIRLISIPELDPCVLGTSSTCLVTGTTGTAATMRTSIENGARLFGVDLAAFRSRMIAGQTPVGDPQGINQVDRQLNCVGCHIPIARTGESPSEIGAEHLSNKWIPLFSDLLIHDMGQIPQGKSDPVPPPPVSLRAGTFEISRTLADFALPAQGLAFGTEWRTPPLMGLGKFGPPFLHDIRVYVTNRNHPDGTAQQPARTVQTSSDTGVNTELIVRTLDDALDAAIELHDLPPPDSVPPPLGGGCPVPPGGSAGLVCPPLSSATAPAGNTAFNNRSEARNVMRRWRALTDAQQQDVVNFLKAL